MVRNGKTIAIVGAAQDITERKKADESLLEKEERENLILRSLPMAFYNVQFFNNDSQLWVSEQVDRISGFTDNTFLEDQTFWSSRAHPDERELALRKYQTIYENGSVAIEYRWQCADGIYRWFYDLAVLIRDEQGNPKEIIGTWRAINERKRAEKELKYTLSLVKATLESTADGILVVDKEGKIVRVNPEVQNLFGYSKSELLGQEISLLIPQQFKGAHNRHIEGYINNPRKRRMGDGLDLYGLKKDGREFSVEIMLSPITQRDKKMTLCTVRDVSDKKIIEQKLKNNEAFRKSRRPTAFSGGIER